MVRSLALALCASLAFVSMARAETPAGPQICERKTAGGYGSLTVVAVLKPETGALSFAYAQWYVADDGKPYGPELTVSYWGDGWTLTRPSLLVSYDGRRPPQSVWASVTLDDGDSRLAQAGGIGPEYVDDGDRYAEIADANFVRKTLRQSHATVELTAADGTVLGTSEVAILREEAETALAETLVLLRDDAEHPAERCRTIPA